MNARILAPHPTLGNPHERLIGKLRHGSVAFSAPCNVPVAYCPAQPSNSIRKSTQLIDASRRIKHGTPPAKQRLPLPGIRPPSQQPNTNTRTTMKLIPISILAVSTLLLSSCNPRKEAVDDQAAASKEALEQEKDALKPAAKEASAAADASAEVEKARIKADLKSNEAQIEADKKKVEAEAEAAKAKIDAEEK